MQHPKFFAAALCAAVDLLVPVIAAGQAGGDGRTANVVGGAGTVRWEIQVPNNGGTLTVSFPDGRSVRKTFRAGGSPEINLGDKQLENLPDGVYGYDLQIAPVIPQTTKEGILKARGKDDDSESDRTSRKRAALPAVNQSGSFSIVNGAIIV